MPSPKWISIIVPLVTIACGAPEPGVPVTFDDICDAKYDPPAGQGGSDALTRVSIEGYLAPPAMFSMCSDTCSFDLFENADGTGRHVFYSVKLGSGKNKLEPLPERFSPADFKLHTQDGNTLGFGDKVRLTGGRLGSGKDCQIYRVDLIETP